MPTDEKPDASVAHPLDRIESKSSILQKIPARRRRDLDAAVVDHDPPSYRGVYNKFHLANHGVSFTAFYYYARRLRHQADLLDLARLVLPDNADVPAAIHQLVSHRLLESLLHEDPSPRALQRLTDAYRVATQALLALQKQKALLEEAVRKQRAHDTTCFRSATGKFEQLIQQELELKEAQERIAGTQEHAPEPGP